MYRSTPRWDVTHISSHTDRFGSAVNHKAKLRMCTVGILDWFHWAINRLERWGKTEKYPVRLPLPWAPCLLLFTIALLNFRVEHAARRLCAAIIQSWGINAHREENRRTQAPCAHTCGRSSPVQKTTTWCFPRQVQLNMHGCIVWKENNNNLPLILMFSSFMRGRLETRLHVVTVGDRIEENKALEPEYTLALSILTSSRL